MPAPTNPRPSGFTSVAVEVMSASAGPSPGSFPRGRLIAHRCLSEGVLSDRLAPPRRLDASTILREQRIEDRLSIVLLKLDDVAVWIMDKELQNVIGAPATDVCL